MTKAIDQDDLSTRGLLIAAAQEEIAHRGWGGVRTRGIAGRAGVNSALVHYHFGSLDDLKHRALEAALESVADETIASALTAATAAGTVRQIGEAMGATRVESAQWRVLTEAFLQAPREPLVAEAMLRLIDGYRQVAVARLDAAVEQGEIPADTDTEGLAGALLALLDGVALHQMMIPDLDVSRIVEAFAALLENPED